MTTRRPLAQAKVGNLHDEHSAAPQGTAAPDQVSPFTKCGTNVRIGQNLPDGRTPRTLPFNRSTWLPEGL